MKLLMFLSFFCFLMPDFVMAETKVIDGDSFWLNGQEIRLEGIDAPEYNQKCYDEKENLYDCGNEAAKALRNLITKDIKCKQVAKDRYKREVAVCEVNGKIINQEMVALGWAVAYKRYSTDYVTDEILAKKSKKGIWQGRFMRPELFRALER